MVEEVGMVVAARLFGCFFRVFVPFPGPFPWLFAEEDAKYEYDDVGRGGLIDGGDSTGDLFSSPVILSPVLLVVVGSPSALIPVVEVEGASGTAGGRGDRLRLRRRAPMRPKMLESEKERPDVVGLLLEVGLDAPVPAPSP